MGDKKKGLVCTKAKPGWRKAQEKKGKGRRIKHGGKGEGRGWPSRRIVTSQKKEEK